MVQAPYVFSAVGVSAFDVQAALYCLSVICELILSQIQADNVNRIDIAHFLSDIKCY